MYTMRLTDDEYGVIVSNQKIVRISNEIVRCVQGLTLNEKRLLMLIVTKISDDNIDADIDVTVLEYSQLYGTERNNTYRTLKDAQNKLWNAEFIMGDKRRRWLITTDYLENDGAVTSRIHPDLKPHVIDLKKCYTQYFLRRAGNFRSMYSWRMFELLMQFRKTGFLKISVTEFKEVLEIPAAYDVDFSAVRHKVINKALAEIKAAGLAVKMKAIKKGRIVHMLEFTFPTEHQADWIANAAQQIPAANSKRLNKKYIEKHAKPGESYSEAQERLQRELDKQQQEVNHQQKSA